MASSENLSPQKAEVDAKDEPLDLLETDPVLAKAFAGKVIPHDLIQAENAIKIFPDIATRPEWPINPDIVYKFDIKTDLLIQIAGNWRLVKWRKTNEIYDCL